MAIVNRRKFIAMAGVAVSGGIAGCGSDTASDTSSGTAGGSGGGGGDTSGGSATDGGGSGGKLKILSDEFYEEDMGAGVRGTVQNASDSEIGYVGVRVEFLNSEGTRISKNFTNTSDLGGGQKWKFDVMFLGDDASNVDDYKVEVSNSAF